MDKSDTLNALSALAHASRLDAFRLLVQAGQDGLAAGEVAARLGALCNTTSTNLAILARSGLVRSERDGRSVRYFANFPRMSELVGYLLLDCCRGAPAVIDPVVASLCCEPTGE